jgi:hypothetical protein
MEGMSRLPRFNRSPNAARIRLTERDREIISLVHRHRFLCSIHLVQLLNASRQRVLRRLQLLYHHGYLERPRTQIAYYERGSRPMVYGLGNKGAALLKRAQKLAFHELDWGEKNRAVTRMFLDHALLISDVMVALEISCRQSKRVRLLTGKEIQLPDSMHGHRQPFRWSVLTRNKSRLGVIPDAAFVLEFLDQPQGRNRVLYFLEADCGTMPVSRSTLTQSSFHRKLLAYEATWSQEVHRRRFGFNRFRVITVTTSTARVGSLIEACQRLQTGRGLFLFTDHLSLTKHEDILSLPFQAGHSDAAEMLAAD